MTTTLLVDGDVLRYQFAFRNQTDFDFGDTGSGQYLDPEQALDDVDDFILECQKVCDASRVVVCLTDDDHNWRKDLYPEYKENRNRAARPVLHPEISKHMRIEYETYERPGLEADDVMGILSTSPRIITGEKVIVSLDKDMETIPGYLYNPNNDETPRYIDQAQADRNHLKQALTGDAVDNYPGCPGVGDKKAEEILSNPYRPYTTFKRLTRGANKGRTQKLRVEREPADSVWEAIVSHFVFAGLTEEDALIQAQVARICRRSDYDFSNKRVIPWTPE